jgi:tetratricopeptide (TPR) repeat protein
MGLLGWGLALRPAEIRPDGSKTEINPVRRVFNRNAGPMRLTNWAVGLAMARAHPWSGVGLNNYRVAWPELRADLTQKGPNHDRAVHAPRATKAHNEYLQLGAESGIGGLLVLMGGFLTGGIYWRRRYLQLTSDQQRRDFLLLLTGVLVVGLHALVSFPLHLPATAAALACLMGALESAYFGPPGWGRVRVPWRPFLSFLLMLVALLLAFGALREFRADLRQRQGWDYFRLGRFADARPLLEAAVTNRFWPGDGLFYLAACQVAQGDHAAGVQTLQQSLKTEPTFEAYLHLAEELADAGDFPGAVSCLEILEGCEPTQRFRREAHLARATVAIRRSDLDRARLLLGQLLAAEPEHHRAWITFAYLEALAGNDSAAARCYRKAIQIIDAKLAHYQSFRSRWGAGQRARLERQRTTAGKGLASVSP